MTHVQQRLPGRAGQRVGEAITKIEVGRVLAFAVTASSVPGDLDMISGDGNRLNRHAVQQQVEYANQALSGPVG
ncbi:MAG: hypothetical protein ACRER6_09495 [Pseudomonas sp.]